MPIIVSGNDVTKEYESVNWVSNPSMATVSKSATTEKTAGAQLAQEPSVSVGWSKSDTKEVTADIPLVNQIGVFNNGVVQWLLQESRLTSCLELGINHHHFRHAISGHLPVKARVRLYCKCGTPKTFSEDSIPKSHDGYLEILLEPKGAGEHQGKV